MLWLDFVEFHAWAKREESYVWSISLWQQEELSHGTQELQEAGKLCMGKLSLNQGIVVKI